MITILNEDTQDLFEKITKKEFINILKNSENNRLCSFVNLSQDKSTEVMQKLFNGNFEVKDGRTCKKAQSNALMFSDGSWLYFNDLKDCYKHNNVILTLDEHYDTFDKCFYDSIIAYAVREI